MSPIARCYSANIVGALIRTIPVRSTGSKRFAHFLAYARVSSITPMDTSTTCHPKGAQEVGYKPDKSYLVRRWCYINGTYRYKFCKYKIANLHRCSDSFRHRCQ